MKYCPHCGSKLSDPLPKFCSNCGKSIVDVAAIVTPPQSPKENSNPQNKTNIKAPKKIPPYTYLLILVMGIIGLMINDAILNKNGNNSQSFISSNKGSLVNEYNKPRLVGGYSENVGAVLEISLQSVKQTGSNDIEILLHSKCKILRYGSVGSVGTFLQIKATLTDIKGSIATDKQHVDARLDETVEIVMKIHSVSDISISDVQSLSLRLQNFDETLSPFSSGNGNVLPEISFTK